MIMEDDFETPAKKKIKQKSEAVRATRKNLFNVAVAAQGRHKASKKAKILLPKFSIQKD